MRGTRGVLAPDRRRLGRQELRYPCREVGRRAGGSPGTRERSAGRSGSPSSENPAARRPGHPTTKTTGAASDFFCRHGAASQVLNPKHENTKDEISKKQLPLHLSQFRDFVFLCSRLRLSPDFGFLV